MTDFNRDIIIGAMFIIGLWSFISGAFIVSTLLFGTAAIFTNIVMRNKLNS